MFLSLIRPQTPGATMDHNLQEKELQATNNRGQQRLPAENQRRNS